MNTKKRKLISLDEVISKMPSDDQAEIKSIRQYYDTLYALREKREQLGLTQEDLAKMTGLPRPTISKIESGSRNIRVENLLKLSRALNMKIYITNV